MYLHEHISKMPNNLKNYFKNDSWYLAMTPFWFSRFDFVVHCQLCAIRLCLNFEDFVRRLFGNIAEKEAKLHLWRKIKSGENYPWAQGNNFKEKDRLLHQRSQSLCWVRVDGFIEQKGIYLQICYHKRLFFVYY